ncbi:phenylacetate--CoA ligase family protein [candidate division KSB1 bacterium]|nr:phenylacetate--CoA ligase family protein [candidate division KSB1 bacterium]
MIEFRFSDFLAPGEILYWRRLLWKSQYFPVEELKKLQWKLLSRMLDRCFNRVPYYQKLFRDRGLKRENFQSIDDLSKIPLLSRDDLLQRRDEFKANDFNRHRPRQIRTSGTTGASLDIFWDIHSNVLELLCQYRHFSWNAYRLGDPFLDIRSLFMDEPKGYRWNRKCRGLEISTDIIDSTNIEKYADLLRKYKIKLWRGYPESIDKFCRLLDKAGINDVKPRTIISVSVTVLDYHRQFIESWSGIPLCDNYGMDEHAALITQCPQGGYHINSEYGIVEILKQDNSPARPGEEGRIVATGLHNRAFPLLRYDTNDFAVVSDQTCSCGRTLPLIERLTGRSNDFIMDSNGKWLSAPAWPMYMISGIKKAQLIQESRFLINLFIVLMDPSTKRDDQILIDAYKKRYGRSMKVRIFYVDEVPFPRHGQKYKFAYSKIKRGE